MSKGVGVGTAMITEGDRAGEVGGCNYLGPTSGNRGKSLPIISSFFRLVQ